MKISKKNIIAIAAGAIVLLGMSLGIVSFKGSSSVSFSSSVTTEAGETTTTTRYAETSLGTNAGV